MINNNANESDVDMVRIDMKKAKNYRDFYFICYMFTKILQCILAHESKTQDSNPASV